MKESTLAIIRVANTRHNRQFLNRRAYAEKLLKLPKDERRILYVNFGLLIAPYARRSI